MKAISMRGLSSTFALGTTILYTPGLRAENTETATSTASSEGASSAGMTFTGSLDIQMSRAVNDFRQGWTVAPPNSRLIGLGHSALTPLVNPLSIAETRFSFDWALPPDTLEGTQIDLRTELPLFSATAQGPSTYPQGSEFGGFSALTELTFPEADMSLRAGFADRSSSTLHLIDSHEEIDAGIYFLRRGVVQIEVGPEVSWPFAVDASNGVDVTLAPTWGASAKMTSLVKISSDDNLQLSLGTVLKRTNSYQVQGIEQGGGGLLCFSPSLSYEVMRGFWSGIRADLPAFRPEGREAVLANADLPGLYGPSLGFFVEAKNF